jgi:hypothetical protein
LESDSLNLLEPSGPVQAGNGVALPLPYNDIYVKSFIRSLEHNRQIIKFYLGFEDLKRTPDDGRYRPKNVALK